MIRPRPCNRCTACGVPRPNMRCTVAVGSADSLNDAMASAIRCSFSSPATVRAYWPALSVGASTSAASTRANRGSWRARRCAREISTDAVAVTPRPYHGPRLIETIETVVVVLARLSLSASRGLTAPASGLKGRVLRYSASRMAATLSRNARTFLGLKAAAVDRTETSSGVRSRSTRQAVRQRVRRRQRCPHRPVPSRRSPGPPHACSTIPDLAKRCE